MEKTKIIKKYNGDGISMIPLVLTILDVTARLFISIFVLFALIERGVIETILQQFLIRTAFIYWCVKPFGEMVRRYTK